MDPQLTIASKGILHVGGIMNKNSSLAYTVKSLIFKDQKDPVVCIRHLYCAKVTGE